MYARIKILLFRSLFLIQNLGLSKSTLKSHLESYLYLLISECYFFFDTVTIPLRWNVINVIFKFAKACMTATCLDWEVQVQGNKEYLGK